MGQITESFTTYLFTYVCTCLFNTQEKNQEVKSEDFRLSLRLQYLKNFQKFDYPLFDPILNFSLNPLHRGSFQSQPNFQYRGPYNNNSDFVKIFYLSH